MSLATGILDQPADSHPFPTALTRQSRADESIQAAKIMIIDDIVVNVRVAQAHLQSAGYSNFVTLSDSKEALDRIQSELPDVILLDIMMPDVSGLEILQWLRSDERFARLPVLILTGAESRELKHEALQLGATDFLTKPIDIEELLPRVRNSLVIKSYEDDLKSQVRQRTAELERSEIELIHCLARAAESRDSDTGSHIIRVGKYAGIIGEELGMDQFEVYRLMQAATLHDVGKIGIPDAILQKKGKLTSDEMAEMQRHCGIGRRVLELVPGFDDFFVQDHTSIGAKIMQVCSSPTIQLAREIADIRLASPGNLFRWKAASRQSLMSLTRSAVAVATKPPFHLMNRLKLSPMEVGRTSILRL